LLLTRIIELPPRASPSSEFVNFCLRARSFEASLIFLALSLLRKRSQVVEHHGAVVRAGEQIVLLSASVFLLLILKFRAEKDNSVYERGVLRKPLDNAARC